MVDIQNYPEAEAGWNSCIQPRRSRQFRSVVGFREQFVIKSQQFYDWIGSNQQLVPDFEIQDLRAKDFKDNYGASIGEWSYRAMGGNRITTSGVTKDGLIFREQIQKLYESKFCPYCGLTARTTSIDHFLPKEKFVTLAVCPANLIATCHECNTRKLDRASGTRAELFVHPIEHEITSWHFISSLLLFRLRNTDPTENWVIDPNVLPIGQEYEIRFFPVVSIENDESIPAPYRERYSDQLSQIDWNNYAEAEISAHMNTILEDWKAASLTDEDIYAEATHNYGFYKPNHARHASIRAGFGAILKSSFFRSNHMNCFLA